MPVGGWVLDEDMAAAFWTEYDRLERTTSSKPDLDPRTEPKDGNWRADPSTSQPMKA